MSLSDKEAELARYQTVLQAQASQLFGKFRHLDELLKPMKKQFLCSQSFNVKQPAEDHQKRRTRIYVCKECAKEWNSGMCLNCFENSKHKHDKYPHNYATIEVGEGCCDCGDSSKWDQNYFCSSHSCSNKLSKNLQEKIRQQFLDFCRQGYSIFCQKLKQLEQNEEQIKKQQNILQQPQEKYKKTLILKENADKFGQAFLGILSQLNRDNYAVSKACIKWLTEQKAEKRPAYKQLMQLQKLQLTAEACFDFYRMLFFDFRFKEKILPFYFQLYSTRLNYPCSKYYKFSAQLLNCSKTISQLSAQKQITSLICYSNIDYSLKDENLRVEIKKFGQCYHNYYKDLQQFLFRKDDKKEQKNFMACQNIDSLFSLLSYPLTLGKNQQCLKLANQLIYQIEEQAMATCVLIIEKKLAFPSIEEIEEGTFIQKGLKRSFYAVIQQIEKKQVSQLNLFFTNFRVFSMFLFVYLYDPKRKENEQIISAQTSEKLMKQLELSKECFMKYILQVVETILKYFFKIGQAMSLNSSIERHQSFFFTYFGSTNPNLLLYLDYFLLKFVCSSFFVLNQGNVSQICSMINEKLKQLSQQFELAKKEYDYSLMQKKGTNQKFKVLQGCINSLSSFVNMILQSLHSNLPQLGLISRFETILKGSENQSLFNSFYTKVIWAMKPQDNRISKADLKNVTNYLFFNESYYFDKILQKMSAQNKLYITQRAENNLEIDDIQGIQVNFDYFYSLRFKLNQQDMSKLIKKHSILALPFEQDRLLNISLLQNTKYSQLVLRWMEASQAMSNKRKQFIRHSLIKQLIKVGLIQKSQSLLSLACQSQQPDKLQQVKIIRQYLQRRQNKSCVVQVNSFFQEVNQTQELGKAKLSSFYPRFECMFSQRCQKNNSKKDLYMVCFARQTNIDYAFGVGKQDWLLTFSTCGHFIHLQCFFELMKEDSLIYKCQQCQQKFNLILDANTQESQLLPVDHEVKRLLFKKRIAPFIRKDKQLQIQIFKSLVLFLRHCLIISDFSFFEKIILFYKYLYMFLVDDKELKWALKQKFDEKCSCRLDQCELYRLSFLKLKELFLLSTKQGSLTEVQLLEIQEYKKNRQEQSSFLSQILEFFQKSKSSFKIQRKLGNSQISNIFSLSMKLLPINLKDLPAKHQCSLQLSNSQSRHCFLCLLPVKIIKTICFSSDCFLDSVKHFLNKEDLHELVCIDTSTGQILYFYKQQNDKILVRKLVSLYFKNGKAYEGGCHYKKQDFHLSEQKWKEIISQLIAGTLVQNASFI